MFLSLLSPEQILNPKKNIHQHTKNPLLFVNAHSYAAPMDKKELNDDSPLSAASSSGTRTVPMPNFQALLASLQVR